MGTDPDPNKIRAILHSDGAVIDSDSRGPQIPDSLEMEGGVRWVLFQELEVFVGHSLDGFRQARQQGPETSGGAVHLHFGPFGLLLVGLTH